MVTELAEALGLKVATLRKRLESIDAAPATSGLAITPPAPTMPAPPLPVEQRAVAHHGRGRCGGRCHLRSDYTVAPRRTTAQHPAARQGAASLRAG